MPKYHYEAETVLGGKITRKSDRIYSHVIYSVRKHNLVYDTTTNMYKRDEHGKCVTVPCTPYVCDVSFAGDARLAHKAYGAMQKTGAECYMVAVTPLLKEQLKKKA